jgi:hypothetical protein
MDLVIVQSPGMDKTLKRPQVEISGKIDPQT